MYGHVWVRLEILLCTYITFMYTVFMYVHPVLYV